MGTTTKTFCLGVTTVVIAYLYLHWQPNDLEDSEYLNAIEKQVMEAWAKEIKQPEKPFSRLAVG